MGNHYVLLFIFLLDRLWRGWIQIVLGGLEVPHKFLWVVVNGKFSDHFGYSLVWPSLNLLLYDMFTVKKRQYLLYNNELFPSRL
jgi:hypothetical protein